MSDNVDYRYLLFREIFEARSGKLVTFVMLNPSTANAVAESNTDDDQTIKRCINFAKAWGYGRLLVVNLFAYRSSDPADLVNRNNNVVVGPGNDDVIRVAIAMADKVICAWGNNVSHIKNGHTRVEEVLRAIKRAQKKPHHLGLTKKGHPKHPGRLSIDTQLEPWV